MPARRMTRLHRSELKRVSVLTRLYKNPSQLAVRSGEPVTLRGTLRALHLDKDWLEIAAWDTGEHSRLEKAGEVLDDVIGPMVNRQVSVTAIRHRRKYLYRDIELDD